MNVIKESIVAGRESPLNAGKLDELIARLQNLRAEYQDGILKVWEWDVAPDETNWSIGVRYTQDRDTTIKLLRSFGARYMTVKHNNSKGGLWSCAYETQDGTVETDLFNTELDSMAMMLLNLLREHKSQVT